MTASIPHWGMNRTTQKNIAIISLLISLAVTGLAQETAPATDAKEQTENNVVNTATTENRTTDAVNTSTPVRMEQTAPKLTENEETKTETEEEKTGLEKAEDWVQRTKHPVSWFSWGADLRIREEYASSVAQDKNPANEYNYQRFRIRFWGTIQPFENLSFSGRGVTAKRNYIDPDSKAAENWDYLQDELIADNLYIKVHESDDMPVTLIVGRQDIANMDTPWLLREGTTKDGSRTIYFDAARAIYTTPDGENTVNVLGIIQKANEDAWIAPVHASSQRRYIAEQDSTAAVALWRNTSLKNMRLDGLFIYKHDHAIDRPGTQQADTFTFSPKVVETFNEHLTLSAEVAIQVGRRNTYDKTDSRTQDITKDVLAGGALAQLTYALNDPLKNKFTGGLEYLSGAKKDSDMDNSFDLLWGRYARFDEFGPYCTVDSKRSANYNNLLAPIVAYSITPLKNLDCIINYRPTFALENPLAGTAYHTDNGKFKGHLFQTWFKYKFNSHFQGHLMYEGFQPGNYYAPEKREYSNWFRAELLLTY